MHLFTALVIGYIDAALDTKCFPASERVEPPILFTRRRSMVLEMQSFSTSKVMTRITEILLREKLGYHVEVRDYSAKSTRVDTVLGPYRRLAAGTVDMNAELWPYEQVSATLKAQALETASDLGDLGYTARSGWFIPADSLRDVATGQLGDKPWRALMPYLTEEWVQGVFANWSRLPEPMNRCTDEPDGRSGYNCSRGEYSDASVACCTKADSEAGRCPPELRPCSVLVSISPLVNAGHNEALINATGLKLMVQYYDYLKVIDIAADAVRNAWPVLIHTEEPSPILATGRFIRVRFTDPLYCTPHRTIADGRQSAQTSADVAEQAACDFPYMTLTKMAKTSLQMTAPSAFKLMTRMKVSYPQMNDMLRNIMDPETYRRKGVAHSQDAFDRLVFDEACAFLRSRSACAGDLPGCWRFWVNAPDTDLPPIPWASLIASPEGPHVVDVTIVVLISLLACAVVYVFGRGDDGYTSGRAGWTLPDLFCGIWRRASQCACLRTQAVSTSDVAVFSTTLPEKGVSGEVEAKCSVTLGRSVIVVAATDPYVAIPLLRLDSTKGGSDVLLQTVDGREGNGGRYGRDYGAISSEATSDTVVSPSLVQLTFSPGTRLKFAYVELLERKMVTTGEHCCAEFVVALSDTPAGAHRTMVGPLQECVVRVIKPSLARTLLLPRLDAATDSSGSGIWSKESIPTPVARGLSIAGSFLDLGQAELSNASADVMTRLRLVVAFLRESFKLSGLLKKVLWHQLSYLILALFVNLIEPLAYTYVVAFGIQRQRWDVSGCVALLMLLLRLVEYRISLNYFHGSMLVLQHLRASLSQKYLSFTRLDHLRDPTLSQRFHVAITTTAEEIRNGLWKGIFHNGLPSLYGVLSSVLYLILFQRRGQEIALSIVGGLVVVIFGWYATRAKRGAALGHVELHFLYRAEAELQRMLSNWSLLRETNRELRAVQRVFDGFWNYIRKGLYVTWYHRFYTKWPFTLCRLAAIYAIWFLSPHYFGDTASFVALVTAFGRLAKGLQAVAEDFLDVLVSTSKLNEVAVLLHMPTDEQARAQGGAVLPRRTHAKLTTELDAVIRCWEVNAEDAQATMALIAQTRALEALADSSMDPSRVVSDLADLMTCWASLLDQDAVDDGGSIFIFDVHFSAPHFGGRAPESQRPVPPVALFVHFCVDDATGDTSSVDAPAASRPVRLPATTLIGLRTPIGMERQRDALVHMLGGLMEPQEGIARCTTAAQLVDAHALSLFNGSLRENLLQNAMCRITGSEPSSEDVWTLCHRVGMSEALIGSYCGALVGWEDQRVHTSAGAVSLTHNDAVCVALVRALLARPTALLLHAVGAGWPRAQQLQLLLLLRAYLDGSLAQLTHRHAKEPAIKSRQVRTSVLWSVSEGCLELLTSGDMILSIESESRATLRKVGGGGE